MLSDYAAYATLPAIDLARARQFYEKILGLEIDQETPAGVMYRAKDSRLFVFPSSFAGTNQATAAGFRVPDLTATVKELKGRGVRFEDYDLPNFKTVDGIFRSPMGQSAWFKDTEGNIIGLVQLD